MRKISGIISSLAIAAIAFVGCEQVEEQVAPSSKNITLNFVAETVDPTASKATLTPNEGETAFDAAWEATDQIGIYALVGDDITENALGTWSGSSFSAHVSGTTGTDGLFSAAYPYSSTGDIDFGSARTQDGNVYNSLYDVMYANDVEAPLSEDATITLPMKRQTAIAYFHLTGGPVDATGAPVTGETVQNATLTVEGANIAGSFTYDDSGIISDGTANSITITFAEGHRPSASDFTLWFNVLPVNCTSLTLEVETENYTLTINNTNGSDYKAGKLYKVSAAVPSTMWEGKGEDTPSVFVKVTSVPDNADWSGDYLIVYETESLAFDGSLETLDAVSNTKSVTIVDGQIAATNDMKEIMFTVAKKTGSSDIYNLKSTSGKYISGTTTIAKASNGIKQADSDSNYEITFGIDNNNAIVYSQSSDQKMILRYNKANDQHRFRFYKSGQEPVQLYKLAGEPAPEKTLSSIVVSGTPTTMEYTEGDSFDPAGLVVTATYDDNSTANVTESAEWTISPSELTIGTTSVSVTASVGEVTSEAYVINGITVNAIPSLTTIDQIFEAATAAGKTATDTRITFNEWVVSGIKQNESSANVYVTDGTKGFIVYGAAPGFAVGDIISGTAYCKVQLYNGAAELTELTSSTEGITVTKGGTITPVQTTIANLSGVNTGAVIDLGQLTYNGTQFTDGENTITPYNTFMSLPTFTSGKKYNVSGIFIIYNTTKEIAPRDANDITEVPAEKYGITINVNNTAYGSVTTNAVDNQAVEGQEVALTVSPAEGYKLASLTVVDSDDQSVDVSNNKFTMPAKDVTVSATFEVIPTHTVTLATCTNGSVSATINGEALVSGSSVSEGTVINITATPASGSFIFSSWNITGATAAAATASTTITVGTQNIEISATFASKPTGPVTLFKEGFGNNANSARAWDDSYKEQSGISSVYNSAVYTMTNVKQGKNTTGSIYSGLNQSSQGTDAVFEVGPLNVSSYSNMKLTYQWKAASTKGTYATRVYYKTSGTGSYTEIPNSATGATTFVEVSVDLPEEAQSSTLYLKIVFNTSNTQAIIDEVELISK